MNALIIIIIIMYTVIKQNNINPQYSISQNIRYKILNAKRSTLRSKRELMTTRKHVVAKSIK